MLTKLIHHIVECDQCGAEASAFGGPRRKAVRFFRQRGWEVHTSTLADLCPYCLRLDEIAQSGASE